MWMDSMNWGPGLNKKEEVCLGQASIALSSLMGETERAAASCSSHHDSTTSRDCWSWQVPDLILPVLTGLASHYQLCPNSQIISTLQTGSQAHRKLKQLTQTPMVKKVTTERKYLLEVDD